MITKYKLYKESLLNKLDGPSEDEIIDNLKNNPNKLLKDSEKSYESIINTYRYPFDNIVILLNSYEQVLSVIKYIETKYNVKIYDYEYLNYPPRNIDCLILNVESLYELKYNKNHDTKFGDTMFTLSNVREDILNFIDNRTGRGYYNRNDVLNSNQLNSIDSLLSRGIKNTFSSIYNKPNENIYESHNVDHDVYTYPYKRIIIMIKNQNEYEKLVKYIERIFNININIYLNFDGDEIKCATLKIFMFYAYLNTERKVLNDDNIFGMIKLNSNPKNNKEFLISLNNLVSSDFYNRNHTLTITNISNILSLLKTGELNSFNSLYNKPVEKTYESLLNKLTGPSLEDIELELRNKFNSGSIDITKYINKAKEYGVNGPSEDEISEHYKNLLLKHRISFNQFYREISHLKHFNITFDEIKKIYNNCIIGLKDLISLSVKFNFIDECRKYLDDKMEIIIEEIIDGSLYYDIDRIKKLLNLSNRYILDKTKNMNPNQKMIISTQLFLITELRKAIEEGADISYRSYYIVELLRFYSKYNKKAKPLLDYILSILNYPEDYNKYVENYFSECVIKNVKIDNKIYNGLVKGDEVRLIINRTTDICYITINNGLYITLGKIYEKTSDLKNIFMNNLFKTNLTDRLEIYQDDNIIITLYEFNNKDIEIL